MAEKAPVGRRRETERHRTDEISPRFGLGDMAQLA